MGMKKNSWKIFYDILFAILIFFIAQNLVLWILEIQPHL